jgi:hypothetical protein
MLGGLRPGQGVTAQDQRRRTLRADPLRRPPQVAATGMDPGGEEARVEAGARRRDDDVAGQRQVDAGPDGGAAHRGNGRHGRPR